MNPSESVACVSSSICMFNLFFFSLYSHLLLNIPNSHILARFFIGINNKVVVLNCCTHFDRIFGDVSMAEHPKFTKYIKKNLLYRITVIYIREIHDFLFFCFLRRNEQKCVMNVCTYYRQIIASSAYVNDMRDPSKGSDY